MMKKNLIYLLVFTLCFAFISCEKDNKDEVDVSANTISAKWEVLPGNSPYASFEFNKDGNYIVVENNFENKNKSASKSQKNSFFKKNSSNDVNTRSSESNLSPIHFGTYKIEGNKIILSGFGLLEVISLTYEEFSFSFTLESTGEKNSFVANKSAEPISTSSRTEMLCRTWIIQKVTVNGEEEDEEIVGSIALFSRAGTYLVLYADGEEEAGLSEWKWANKEETMIYYSWDNWEDNWTDNIVSVNQLNNNALILQQIINDDTLVYYLTLKK